MNNIPDRWGQFEIIHCPIKDCKGMLLGSIYRHELKCSDCNKEFMYMNKLIEVK